MPLRRAGPEPRGLGQVPQGAGGRSTWIYRLDVQVHRKLLGVQRGNQGKLRLLPNGGGERGGCSMHSTSWSLSQQRASKTPQQHSQENQSTAQTNAMPSQGPEVRVLPGVGAALPNQGPPGPYPAGGGSRELRSVSYRGWELGPQARVLPGVGAVLPSQGPQVRACRGWEPRCPARTPGPYPAGGGSRDPRSMSCRGWEPVMMWLRQA